MRVIMRISNRRSALALCLGALLSLAGCNGDAGPSGPVDPTELIFANVLGVNLAAMTKTPSGLYLQDQVVGTGAQATAGSSVTVDYTGWLHNGSQFDSGTYTVTPLGNAQVIAGWNEGLIGMRVGGRRLLVIPSNLGYGAAGAGNGIIPPYATLVFRVELKTVQ